MRITILLNGENVLSFMRRAGYGFQKEASGEVAFVRRVGQSPFPRFHVYATESVVSGQWLVVSRKEIVINLHIDQKQPTYGSGSVHSGEYDGPAIVAEIERLRALAVSASPPLEPPKPSERRGFFGRLFG